MEWRPKLAHESTVPALLRESVERWPTHEFVITETERLTYEDADRISAALAKRLISAGVGKGTRVATHFPYGTEWVVSWLAIERIGALHMPFSTAYKPAEMRKALKLGDAHLLLAPGSLFDSPHQPFIAEALGGPPGSAPMRVVELPFLRDVWMVDGPFTDAPTESGISDELLAGIEQQVNPADLAITIFTSGTTSMPKAVNHSHGALVRKGVHLAQLLGWHDQDKVFCGMPFFWVGGVAMTVVPALAVGASLLCVDRTEALRSLDLMTRERATRMTGWPGVRGPIMNHPTQASRDIPALEPLPAGNLMGSIGMTESLASYTWPDPEADVPMGSVGCMGAAIDGWEIRIADPDTGEWLPDDTEGAILIRGYGLMQSMYKREREDVFSADGFYDTGDKGKLVNGLLFFNGRHTEMIKTSGNNVAPPEVEAVLKALPGVKDAHVLGVPDEERGEIVAALVIPETGVTLDGETVREQARKELSNYKVPRYVLIKDDDAMPWLATGKPDRLAIKALLAAHIPS
jgi:acyl-CoA synthetase (AMP-forming)/AMP-acid ligase II